MRSRTQLACRQDSLKICVSDRHPTWEDSGQLTAGDYQALTVATQLWPPRSRAAATRGEVPRVHQPGRHRLEGWGVAPCLAHISRPKLARNEQLARSAPATVERVRAGSSVWPLALCTSTERPWRQAIQLRRRRARLQRPRRGGPRVRGRHRARRRRVIRRRPGNRLLPIRADRRLSRFRGYGAAGDQRHNPSGLALP